MKGSKLINVREAVEQLRQIADAGDVLAFATTDESIQDKNTRHHFYRYLVPMIREDLEIWDTDWATIITPITQIASQEYSAQNLFLVATSLNSMVKEIKQGN